MEQGGKTLEAITVTDDALRKEPVPRINPKMHLPYPAPLAVWKV